MKLTFLFLCLFLNCEITNAYVNISSNQFNAVDIDSTSAFIVPSTTVVMFGRDPITSATVRVVELVYTNMSSSVTVFFSTSPTAGWTRDNGTPVFPQTQISLDWDPRTNFSSNTATRYYFTRDAGGAGGPNISIRTWLRYAE